jgi:hypothetical protein
MKETLRRADQAASSPVTRLAALRELAELEPREGAERLRGLVHSPDLRFGARLEAAEALPEDEIARELEFLVSHGAPDNWDISEIAGKLAELGHRDRAAELLQARLVRQRGNHATMRRLLTELGGEHRAAALTELVALTKDPRGLSKIASRPSSIWRTSICPGWRARPSGC